MADEQLTMNTDHITMWVRYIDVVFLIWDGPVKMLSAFLSRLNKNQFNLTFTMAHHSDEVTFLDVTVLRGEGGAIQTHLFRKLTAGNSMFPGSSFHPRPLITSIPYSQYLRTRRNCSDENIFKSKQKSYRLNCWREAIQKHALKRPIENLWKRPDMKFYILKNKREMARMRMRLE